MKTTKSLTILVVDDQSSARIALAGNLDALGHRVLEADSAEWGLELFRRHQPDIVLLDVVMPEHDGYWAARRIREAEAGTWTPIIFLSARDGADDLFHGIECGGDDYLFKPVSPVVLEAKLRAMDRLRAMQQQLVSLSAELHAANEHLQHLSERDGLTGLLNRRGFDRLLRQEIEAARRDEQPLTLVLCDADGFKAYNDALGHVEGDRCLGRLGEALSQVCHRPRDRAARYGGEEFALILPNTPKSGAMTFARAIRRLVKQMALPHPASPVGVAWVTLSGGITTCVPDEHTTPEGMLMRADQALYAAKRRGRDRFFSFEMQLDTVEQRAVTTSARVRRASSAASPAPMATSGSVVDRVAVALGGSQLGAQVVHVDQPRLLDHRLELGRRHRAAVTRHQDALADDHQRGHAADAEGLGQRLLLVGVDLAEAQRGVLCRRRLEDGREALAGPAPRCPEVEHDG